MDKLIILLGLAVASTAQYKAPPETAAIISDTRYLAGDGTFGAAYTQEDGVQFKEESDAAGNRKGSYSYVDPNGQRRTVTYTAGKNGFQAFGDHLPVPPPAPQAPLQPQQHYQPQQQYHQPLTQYPIQGTAPVQPRYQPTFAAQPQYDDGQYREEYNDPNYKFPGTQHVPAPSPQYTYSFGSTPASVAYATAGVVPQYPAVTQQNAHRFLPPGKLNLHRTPDGFSYSFNKS
ncbi:hypothetical protein RUM44_005342 [Polyplax serrata]|uniref:Uncharacterized protein n=1 Tax=Polyplax serrata TaxID=468196 RepID=A0ABR1AD98_POLSC